MKVKIRFFSVLLVALLVVGCAGIASAPESKTIIPEVVSKNGMVASAHPLASQAGLDILKAGGNAIDSAVATAFAIGVVEPNATGIGGEGYIVIYLKDSNKVTSIDYRSRASLTDASGETWPNAGHRAVAVPGTVAGLAKALAQYGTMSLAQVVEPAAKLAEEGFIVSATLAGVIADNFKRAMPNDYLMSIIAPTGLPLEAGDLYKNPDLARTLRLIGSVGPEVFYTGEIAKLIAADMAANGGLIDEADLAAYKAIEREPATGSYRGYDVVSAPAPVGGFLLIQALNMIENYDIRSMGFDSAQKLHLFSEVLARAFDDYYNVLGDPDYVDVPMKALTSQGYADAKAASIKLDSMASSYEPVDPNSEHWSTTHLSVVDKAGNMVALTQTLSSFFGAAVAVPGTGIILNNEMVNFNKKKGTAAYMPGKRMNTTIAPTLVMKDGKAFATLGTPGSVRIVPTLTQIVTNLIDFDMGMQEAIEAPRMYCTNLKGPGKTTMDIESFLFPETEVAKLTDMGYKLKAYESRDLFFGGVQGIIVKNGKLHGGADPRRDGAVLGY
ncbi:MAG: gamma-glutamyltransferase [Spirochaetes bacterium]|nr:gamma-glutamyltransferase [Spirochaetota bacterium]MBU1081598.1 gamma-glutamyltransferase [Spirochaetota bacterium]